MAQPRRGRPPTPLDPDASSAAWLGAEIRARRQAHGLTLETLAALIGFSPQHISEVERAKAPVSRPFVAACDRALDARGKLLALVPAVVYERAMRRHDRDATRRRDARAALGSADHSEARDRSAPSRPAGEDDDVKRRTFLGLGLVALLPPVDGLDGVKRAFGPDVDEWERTAHAYGYDVITAPARDVLPALVADFAELRELLAGSLSDRDRRRLAAVAGQLAALTAGLTVGTGQPHLARQWWRRARQAATASGDAKLVAFACGHQAVTGLYGGYTATQVVQIAREAQAATTTACIGVMHALSARAQAHAVLGQERHARAALTALAGTFERLPADVTDEPVSLGGWPEHRLRHTESYAFMHLGDTRRGEHARERALELYPAQAWRGPTQVRLHRAASLIAGGDVGEGARYATGVLEPLSAGQRADRFVAKIAEHALAVVPATASHTPAVREFREAFTAA